VRNAVDTINDVLNSFMNATYGTPFVNPTPAPTVEPDVFESSNDNQCVVCMRLVKCGRHTQNQR
jgi:hypothetical protein